MKIAFIPIDNRPVCYTMPQIIAGIDSSLEFFIPERELLGDLKKNANIEKLFDWLKALPQMDAMVISLDTLAYGGLIPSRRCPESFEEIKNRIETLKTILESKNAKIYAFSSIMRISNNNYNEEEKDYWSKWGKKIFDYSYQTHKLGCESCITNIIPSEILDDYIETRKRNFGINKIYLKWQKEGLFETLIFSKDDCAEYGFNVQEAKYLEEMGGFTKTGADEIPLSLLSRAIQGEIKICPIFAEPDYKNLISNYEDISIEKSVQGQIELAGCKLADEKDADLILYINNFKEHQGEIVMKKNTESFSKTFPVFKKPYMIADVRFANGSDNNFVKEFLKTQVEDENFYGYSAWNTSANTLGSLICGTKIKFFASKYNKNHFKKLQITRMLDDWAYQANVRQILDKPDESELVEKMKIYENIIENFLDTKINVNYSFPWERLFEVEIEFN
ncbi:DUF4127 family protein [bacterium]|nr:DUF4127 family protein [bacterium]